MKFIVYKYTSPSGKSYVGLTCKPTKRKADHRNSVKDTSLNTKFVQALRRYGYENFSYEIIDRAETLEQACEKEVAWIKYYDSVNNGYNICEGGLVNINYTLPIETVETIVKLLNENTLTVHEIAKTAKTSVSYVSDILNGKGTRNTTEIKREHKARKGSTNGQAKLSEEQVKEVREKLQSGASRKQLQKEYGVSKTLIQMIATNQTWGHVEADYQYKQLEVNGNAKLTSEIVKELKKDLPVMTRKQVAEKYGISVPTVDQIKAGKTWKDV